MKPPAAVTLIASRLEDIAGGKRRSCPPDVAREPAALDTALSPRSKVVPVAHLFGARTDLDPVVEVARRHGLFLVEDCAQSVEGPADRGDPRARASLFGSGFIKTATAPASRGASQICAVPPAPPRAAWWTAGMVFLPLYPEMSSIERKRLAAVVNDAV